MKHRRMLRAAALCGGLALAATLLGCGVAVGAPEEETLPVEQCVATLKFLAAQNEGNYRKIQTWQTTYRFVERSAEKISVPPVPIEPAPGAGPLPPQLGKLVDVLAVREGQAKIALDMAADKLWVRYQEDKSKTRLFTPDGKTAAPLPPDYKPRDQETILTAGGMTTFLHNIQQGPLPGHKEDPMHVGGKSGRIARREAYRPEVRWSDTGELIDPRRFFSVGGVSLLFEALKVDADGLVKEPARAEPLIRLTKTGGPGQTRYVLTLKYRNGTPDDDNVGMPWQFIRFSEPDGFLPVEECMHDRDGSPQVTRSWVYRLIDGIRIPEEFHYKFVSTPGTDLRLDRHLVLVEARLNQPIPAGTFSEEGLDLARGDRYVDDIAKTLQVHDGKLLVPPEEYRAVEGRSWALSYFFWGGLVLAVAAAALAVWERRRQSRVQT